MFAHVLLGVFAESLTKYNHTWRSEKPTVKEVTLFARIPRHVLMVLFELIIYIPVNTFQSSLDNFLSSWVGGVLRSEYPVLFSRTQHSNVNGGESKTSNSLIICLNQKLQCQMQLEYITSMVCKFSCHQSEWALLNRKFHISHISHCEKLVPILYSA